MKNHRNLLLIHCHDLGDFLGCYGHPMATPNLDRLASEGVLFQNHFSTDTICSPSRGSIMTGCYPHTHGLMGLVHRGWDLNIQDHPTLPMILSGQGYHTCLAGIQHEHADPLALGYQTYIKDKDCYSENVADKFISWLDHFDADSGPFMASVGFWEPHRNGLRPSHFRREGAYSPVPESSVKVPPWLPDIPEVRKDLSEFYGAVSHADMQAGKILEALDKKGLKDNTLVVFTTDHGASFIHGKGTLYDGGTKTALMMRCPGLLAENRRFTGLSSHVDILPTLLQLLGQPLRVEVEGKSLVPAIQAGNGSLMRSAVFAGKNFTNSFDPARMARTRRFKYIRKGVNTCIFEFQIPEIELSACDFRSNRAVYDFYSKERCAEELYDLEKDPGELRNLAADPVYCHALEEMRKLLDAHIRETDDPFMNFRNPIRMPDKMHL